MKEIRVKIEHCIRVDGQSCSCGCAGFDGWFEEIGDIYCKLFHSGLRSDDKGSWLRCNECLEAEENER